jgi:hypothetical protein
MPLPSSNIKVLYGTRSEGVKRKREKIAERRHADAIARFETARYVGQGLAKRELSLREMAELVEAAKDGGLLPHRAPSSHESLRQLAELWKAGKQSITDYLPQRSSGRSRKGYDEGLVEMISDAVKRASFKSVRQLTTDVMLAAEKLGLDETVVPKYDAVMAIIKAEGPVVRTGARYGSRAAELRAVAHGTIACAATNEIFTIDELKAPWHEQGWDLKTEELVSVRPSIILVRDYKAGAVIGYHISSPLRRSDPETGRPMREGYDARDVFAAILAATCPEVSPPSTRRFAGWLPSKCIRWDNHPTHKKLAPILSELGRAARVDVTGFFLEPEPVKEGEELPLAERGIRFPKQRPRFPKSRGDIENTVKFAKSFCAGMEGHVDSVWPLDRADEDPMDQRTNNAASGTFSTRRDVHPVSALPTAAQQAADFDARVRFYNERHVNRVHGRTPAARYHQFLPRVSRKGTDVLEAMPLRSGFVQGNGIVVYDDSLEYRFTHHVANKFVLELGAAVTYRVDPLHRGIWAEIDGNTYYLPRKESVAADENRAQLVARHVHAEARDASVAAAGARAAVVDAKHGPGAAAAFRAVADMNQHLLKQAQKATAAAERAERRANKAEDLVLALQAGRSASQPLETPKAKTSAKGKKAGAQVRPGDGTSTHESQERPVIVNQGGRSAESAGSARVPAPRPEGLDSAHDPTADDEESRVSYKRGKAS